MPEEFALEKRRRQRAAVDRNEGAGTPRTLVVYAAGDHFLSRARLAGEKHARVGLRDLLHHLEHTVHRLTVTDDILEAVAAFDLASEVPVLGAKPFEKTSVLYGHCGELRERH